MCIFRRVLKVEEDAFRDREYVVEVDQRKTFLQLSGHNPLVDPTVAVVVVYYAGYVQRSDEPPGSRRRSQYGHLRHQTHRRLRRVGRDERPDPDNASPDPSPGRIERCGDQEVWVAVSLNVFSDNDGAPQLGTARGAVRVMVTSAIETVPGAGLGEHNQTASAPKAGVPPIAPTMILAGASSSS